MVQQHRAFITTWIRNALQNGDFEERQPISSLPSVNPSVSSSERPVSPSNIDIEKRVHNADRHLSSDSAIHPTTSLISVIGSFIKYANQVILKLREYRNRIESGKALLRRSPLSMYLPLPYHVLCELPGKSFNLLIEFYDLLETCNYVKKYATAGHIDRATQLTILPAIRDCYSQVDLLNNRLTGIIFEAEHCGWRRALDTLFSSRKNRLLQQTTITLQTCHELIVSYQTIGFFNLESRLATPSSAPESSIAQGIGSLSLGSSPTFTADNWYRIEKESYSLSGYVLEVRNNRFDREPGLIRMAKKGNFSGQYWQLIPYPDGTYSLRTLSLGTQMHLDVDRDNNCRPLLAPAVDYSGQRWTISCCGSGSRILSNSYSRPRSFLTMTGSPAPCLSEDLSESQFRSEFWSQFWSQFWYIEAIRPVTERKFQIAT
ncbi:hypothetical protein MMC12_008605 [Toensbergia leucococca]|nr:hypothetical protein [Toensbergia leucococca]